MLARYLKLIITLLIVGVLAAYVLLVVIPERSYETARSIGRDFKEAFQFTPEITVKHTIILQQQTAILELATLSQQFYHRYSWTNTWAGSTKQIDIAGTFEAKCGFDLNEKFSIHLEGQQATVYLPEPKILSVEAGGNMTFRDENGYWNWVRDEDRARATNAFITDARKYAEQGTFIENSKATTEEKLKELLKPYVSHVEFVYPQKIWIEQGK